MIIDKALELADKQSLTAAAASTNTIDFGADKPDPNLDFGNGRLACVFTVNTDVTGDVIFKLQDSADGTTFADISATSPGTFKSPKAGTKIVLPIPAHIRRYLRANFAADTATSATTISAGKVSAHVVWGWDDNIPPKGNPL
jgi:hypothetical protein|nr:MAG TPA: major capsid protein [Caudoviricetes sp.]